VIASLLSSFSCSLAALLACEFPRRESARSDDMREEETVEGWQLLHGANTPRTYMLLHLELRGTVSLVSRIPLSFSFCLFCPPSGSLAPTDYPHLNCTVSGLAKIEVQLSYIS